METLQRKRMEEGLDFSRGKMDEVQQLAEGNTVFSYGKTVHSDMYYNAPGRVVIDESYSLLFSEVPMEGLWDLLSRNYRPMQGL
jgi:hypothetical protein